MLLQIARYFFACNAKFLQYHSSLLFNYISLIFALIEIVHVQIIKWFVLDETVLTHQLNT